MLRDYQQDIYDAVVSAFKQGYTRPLVVAPCGAGKSYIFAEMAKNTRGNVLVLTHRQELKEQHEELFRKLGVTNTRVAMILTEANRHDRYERPALIIADEAHLSRSNSWVKVIEFYDTWTVGFTATPIRLDGKPLASIYDCLINGVDTKWLIDHNYLASFEYYAPTCVETDGLRSIAGDYVVSDLERLMDSRAIYGDIIKSYRRFSDGEQCIAYCVSVKHAEKVSELFNAAGIPSRAISAGTPPKIRREIMDTFRSGELRVLCNVGIISEGVSIDSVSACLLLRPTESLALYWQQAMRCMRYMPGKIAKIIDCVGNYSRNPIPGESVEWSLDQPIKKRRNLNREGDFLIRTCPKCFMVFPTAQKCPYCGTDYPLHPREIAAHAEIELARINEAEAAKIEAAKKAARIEQGRASTYEELVAIGRQRGYRYPAQWAAKVIRGRKH